MTPSVTPSTYEKLSELYALLVDSIVLRREERPAFPFSPSLTKHFIRVCINSKEEEIYNECIEAQEHSKEEQGWKLKHDLMLQKICCHPQLAYGNKYIEKITPVILFHNHCCYNRLDRYDTKLIESEIVIITYYLNHFNKKKSRSHLELNVN